MCALIASHSVSCIGRVRGAPFLAVLGVTVLRSVSMSFGVRFISSTGLSPVSIDIRSLRASAGVAAAISRFSFSVVGTLNCLVSFLYFGIVHSIL